MQASELLPLLLGWATLLPLVSFFFILAFGPRMGTAGKCAAYLATGAIGGSALLSLAALLFGWLPEASAPAHGEHAQADPAAVAGLNISRDALSDGPLHFTAYHAAEETPDAEPHAASTHTKRFYAGEFTLPGSSRPWVLGQFGELRLSISYYIDALTVCMFCMVSLIATLIHVYSMGYMHEELSDVTDHEVDSDGGQHLHRPGRYSRFFQYMSLFSFSMLGLVLAGNVAMVFIFWELVGICSYFLIGFYIERKKACLAANKAFIVNRIGDFGMIVGMMALWAGLGTFSFGTYDYLDEDGTWKSQAGIFDAVGMPTGARPSEGMIRLGSRQEVAQAVREAGPAATASELQAAVQHHLEAQGASRPGGPGYGLLVLAGIGIFAGCVGKSAQFPLHVWLPDAMEGPTPVSALVHSATMVAAGVYLVGRFYPAFTPEVLLVIAVVGCVTLFLAATIAITATDIKRVLAYSTVSQLGYMMLALGVGAWLAAMLHLITHAFFKSLLFLCSGSVIHAVHSNEMTDMGGLLKKMPVTAYTMLIGCLAIAGAGLPFVIGWLGGGALQGLGLSGFYSKDMILEQAFAFMQTNSSAWASLFFLAAAGGAAITAFYMFRLWYLTFLGQPRDSERFEHAHESPPAMTVPLIILAVMAISVAWDPVKAIVGGLLGVTVFGAWRAVHRPAETSGDSRLRRRDMPLIISAAVLVLAVVWWFTPVLESVVLTNLLGEAEPALVSLDVDGVWLGWTWPSEHKSHTPAIVIPVTLIAIGAALAGFGLATLMYAVKRLDPAEVRRQFAQLYSILRNKWWFDELYEWLFVRPTQVLSQLVARIDRSWIDWFVDGLARTTSGVALAWDRLADQTLVDGFVNMLARWTYAAGCSLRTVQTGRIRQYVLFIVVGAVALFFLFRLWTSAVAG
jgi:NADH-quinone oxidoreductase subunit L